MHRVMFVATYGDFIATFEYDNVQIWQKLGVEVHCAADFTDKKYNMYTERLKTLGVICHQISFSRSPFSKRNLNAYHELKMLIRQYHIDIIDCHNPVASIFARMAAWKQHVHNVIYTAHGFFFYKGCPIKNKLIYKPIEFLFARSTDALIVINQEDYAVTKRMPLRGKSYYIPGVGIDIEEKRRNLCPVDLHKELGISKGEYIIISVGELNPNKNQEIVLKALKTVYEKHPEAKIHYGVCGQGELDDYLCRKASEYGLEEKFHLLGYRHDIVAVDAGADLFIISSLREGLGVAAIEAMIAGKPVLATNHGGPKDLVESGNGGYLFDPTDSNQLADLIWKMYSDIELGKRFGEFNKKKVAMCDIHVVHKIMENVYTDILKNAEVV